MVLTGEPVNFYLKLSRDEDASPIEEKRARTVLKQLRYQGRKLKEIYVVSGDGTIDRFQERTRRKLGSNAIASRTWLCETLSNMEWLDGRYIPDPEESIFEMDPSPAAVMLVLQGAESPESIVDQLSRIPATG